MDSLGLSIGATNMVAVRTVVPPCGGVRSHPCSATGPPRWPAHGERETERTGRGGVGFSPTGSATGPMIAPDGSSHDAATLAADALESLVRDAFMALHREW